MKKNARTIAIIGTGMIASSLATLLTGHGFHTVVLSRSEKSTRRCLDTVEYDYEQLRKKGLITPEQIAICKSYLEVFTEYSKLEDAECVFECIVENVDEKHKAYRRIEEACPHVRAICSVSSSIVPDILAEGIEKYADRIIVAHPFNPAHMVPYIELCAAEKTREDVIDYVMDLLVKLDKKPVKLKKPTPGFIGNRLQFALLREAIYLVENGIADPRDIDTCLAYSFCPRFTSVGIFEHFDNGGLKLCSTVCENLFHVLSDEKNVPAILIEKVKNGDLGSSTGKGFYQWDGVDMDAYQERVNEPYWKFCNWAYPEQ